MKIVIVNGSHRKNSSLVVTVPGNRPYRKYVSIPINPKGNKQCINCGLCYRSCPVSAIPYENYQVCDRSKCISCLQCVSVCPKNARRINSVILKIAELRMRKMCSGRKMNKLYVPHENNDEGGHR